jgi:hypothetical protein
VHAVWPQEAQPFPAKLTSLTPPNSHSSRSTGPGSKHEAIERDLLNSHDNHMRTFPRPGRSPLLGSNHACRQYGPGPCFFFFSSAGVPLYKVQGPASYSANKHTCSLVTGGVIWRSINVGFLNLTVYSLQGSFPPRFERFYRGFSSAACPFLGVNLSTFAA